MMRKQKVKTQNVEKKENIIIENKKEMRQN